MSIDINWGLLNSPSPSSSSSSPSPSPNKLNSNSHNGVSSQTSTDYGLGGDETDLLSSSLIRTLNDQLSSAKRPSFIGPITITSFSFGNLGPDLEIKDIRDVWRVFDQGDEEGDEEEEIAQQEAELTRREERERARNEKYGIESGLDDERYEYVNPPSTSMNGIGNNPTARNRDGGDYDHERQESEYANRSHRNRNDLKDKRHSYSNSLSYSRTKPPSSFSQHPMTPGSLIPRSISNPHTLSIVNGGSGAGLASGSRSNSGRSYIPFHFDPNSSGLGLNGYHNINNNTLNHIQTNGIIGIGSTSSSLFSPGLGRRPASIASLPLNRASSVVGSEYRNIDEDGDDTGISGPHDRGQNIHNPNTRVKSRKEEREQQQQTTPLTREQSFLHSIPIPPSPPAKPPKDLPQPSTQNSSREIPSIQLHLNLSHKSDLCLTLLTSLQVNYPSNLFMSLPLKISITGFQLESEVVIAYSGEKNRLHLTILDQQQHENDFEGVSRRNSHSIHLDDHRKIPIGQRLLPNLQIESEIGHSDAHVLRNVGKVEKFIIDVIRKTLVDELVFPNFHTIAL